MSGFKQSSVSDAEKKVWDAGTRAWRELKRHKSWGLWMTLGEALLSGRNYALKMSGGNATAGAKYSRAFTFWLTETRLDEIAKADRAAVLKIMDERARVEAWRSTLTETDRLLLNHPRTVWRKFSSESKADAAKFKEGDGEDEGGKDKSGAKAKADVEVLKVRLIAARDHIRMLEGLLRQIDQRVPTRPRALVDPFDEWEDEVVDDDEEGDED